MFQKCSSIRRHCNIFFLYTWGNLQYDLSTKEPFIQWPFRMFSCTSTVFHLSEHFGQPTTLRPPVALPRLPHKPDIYSHPCTAVHTIVISISCPCLLTASSYYVISISCPCLLTANICMLDYDCNLVRHTCKNIYLAHECLHDLFITLVCVHTYPMWLTSASALQA